MVVTAVAAETSLLLLDLPLVALAEVAVVAVVALVGLWWLL